MYCVGKALSGARPARQPAQPPRRPLRFRSAFFHLSKRAVWWLRRGSLTTALILTALQQALRERQPPPGLVHHSDRGLQYASAEYVEVLHQHGMLLSMSRAGNPYDNATCESWIKTLKVEEIYGNQYQDLEDLRSHLREFIDQYYNRDRLHSALSYWSPEKFEQQLADTPPFGAAARVSFPGMGQSINAMGSSPGKDQPGPLPDSWP